jgi:pimeloyl-ACP methyl ester carboxylesterase
MESVIRWALILLAVYILGGAALYFFQRTFLYFPRPYVSVPGLQEITLETHGVRLRGYVANAGQKQLLLYFGGNAEQIARGIAELSPHLPSTTIIGFDYRGYGKSEGRPSEAAIYRDAVAQFDHLAQGYEQVSVLGRSLGSAVSTYLATQRPVDSLVLVTPIDSVARIGGDRFWFYPTEMMIKDRFDSVSRADQITAPVLLLTAADDHLVSEKHLQRLKEQFASETIVWEDLRGVDHNTIQNSPRFGPSIAQFLN